MWTQFKEHLDNNLPESAGKVLDDIETKAQKEGDQIQLLKTIIYRQKVMAMTAEDDYRPEYLQYVAGKLETLDEVPRAVLHSEMAAIYNGYLSDFGYDIANNLRIDGDLSQVEMKYWDKQSFLDRIDYHYAEALKPVEALQAALTADYLCLYESDHSSDAEYEPTMFEFMFHRVAKHYRETDSADDVDPSWNTQLWWLPAEDFIQADLDDSDKPIIKCLKIFQQLIAFNLQNGDAEPNLLLYNDYKRYTFVDGILKEPEALQNALRTLIERNPTDKYFPNLCDALAVSLINQYEASSDDSSLFNNYRLAYEVCLQGVSPDPKVYNCCSRTIDHIKASCLDLAFNQVQLPNEPIPVTLKYRNLEHPVLRIYQVPEKDLKTYRRLRNEELLEALRKKLPVAEQILDLPTETDFRQHSTLIALDPLPEGIYCLVGMLNDTAKVAQTAIMLFQVSRLGFITDSQTGQLHVVTVDRKTGHPVEGVRIEICNEKYNYRTKEYETEILERLQSDANGNAILQRDNGKRVLDDSFKITLRKGNDLLLPNSYFSISGPASPGIPTDHITLFTDRAIYRPGQTVYFEGVAVHHDNGVQTLATNLSSEVRLRDANYQVVSAVTLTTDDYGTFNGSFVLPTDRLNGAFRLETSYGSVSFRVEEYKRPTFEIGFDQVKEQYKLNQDVTVTGNVSALAGFGLDYIDYSYRVVRKTSFPWRCWWWWYPPVSDEQVAYGKGRTDENGRFAVTFNLKPSLKTKPEQQPVFTYEIEVTATSAQGETHSQTYYIRAGYNEIALSTDIPELVEQSAIGDYHIEVVNMSGQPAKSRVKRLIYRFDESEQINYFEANGRSTTLDRQVLSDEELATLFPAFNFHDNAYKMQHKTLVYEDEVEVNEKTAFYPGKKALKPGRYSIELKSLDDPLAVTARTFNIYQKEASAMPYTAMVWNQIDNTSVKPGEKLQFAMGSSASDVKVWVQLLHGEEVRMEQWITLSDAVKRFSYTVKEEDRGGLCLKTAFVKENTYHIQSRSINVPYDNLDLNVTLATMRDKLNPGGEETWTVNVKDYRDKAVQASLLAGMYDASLDAFEWHYWSFDMDPADVWSDGFQSDNHGFISNMVNNDRYYVIGLFNFRLPSDYAFIESYSHVYYTTGRVGGRFLRKGDILESVVYEESAPRMVDAATNETASLAVQADAEEDEAEAGSGAAAQEGEPTLRENFNETAFFFPGLRTDADGNSTFSFTMPDAITRWKLLLLAFTKESQTGARRYEFTSTKPVMIMADMPRYMYDTDTLWFVANVINTGDEAVTPKAKLEIFDATTMQPIDMIVGDPVVNMKQIVPGRSQEVRWKVAAQYDLSLLAFRFTAYAGQFSDAEQHLLPVLSSEIFMTQTLPITVKAETEKTFDFEAIANPESHERDYSLTLNFSTNPVWYAVQSLPYLANVKTDRAETAFYVFYANTLSAYIANHIPNLLAYIKRWQIETPDALMSQLEKDQELKAIMLQETPWVLEAKSETEQRSRIANLFEINTLRQQQTETLNLLEQKQKHNGGWTWFEGMPESPYITTFILTGFGKLQKMDAWSTMSEADQRTAKRICEKAVRYLEYDVAESYRIMKRHKEEWSIGGTTLSELYALSFFEEQRSDRDFAKAKAYYLDRLSKKREWTDFNYNYRAKAALVLYRKGDAKTARLIIQSLKETAQKNDEIGMYWPKRYFAFISHIATHAEIMSAFAEIDQDQELIDQMRVWLLTQKRTNLWENNASTADAIYALLLRGSDWCEEGKDVTLSFGGVPVSTEGGEAGTGFIQRRWNANEVTEAMRHLTVDNPTGHLVWGGLFRQYFVPIDEVKRDESGFKIKRELFVETVTEDGKLLVPVEKRPLKVGDKLTVKLTFESEQDMSFVFVKDLRAAGFEPENVISRYHYGDDMCYYQSTTDTDMEFFIDFLPKGVHQLEYTMFVTKEGNLSNGYALIQCQYAPEFCAYSDGMRVEVKGKGER